MNSHKNHLFNIEKKFTINKFEHFVMINFKLQVSKWKKLKI